jgi:hypothetical protein
MITKIYSRSTPRTELPILPVVYTVDRYKNSVFGGPLSAALSVTANGEPELWDLLERLRCPIEIYTPIGECVWFGYIHEIQITTPTCQVTVSLEAMANSVAVIANEMTTWATHAASIAEYGTKQLLQSLNQADATLAEAARNAILAKGYYPIVQPNWIKGKALSAKITCRGWYQTLDWKYVAVGKGTGDTGTQAGAMATTYGQFFSSVSTITSGVSATVNRDGKSKAGAELLELLNAGTSNARRMLASLDTLLALSIYEEPAYSAAAAYFEDQDHLYDPLGNIARKELCPVGIWVRQRNNYPSSLDLTYLLDAQLKFVDAAEYEPSSDSLTITPRNVQNPWRLGRPPDG